MICIIKIIIMQLSLVQLSWVVWVTAAVFFNAALQWKRHFPTVLQDTLLYGKVKLGTATPVPLFNVPKKWFTYFYAWGVVWNILLLFHFLLVCVIGHSSSKIPLMTAAVSAITGISLEDVCLEGVSQCRFDVLIVLMLIFIQTSRRLYESLFVSVFSDSKMHLLHLLLGLYFYTSLGPTALLHLEQGGQTGTEQRPPVLQLAGLLRWYHFLGLFLFVWASRHQYKCHKILADLRKPQAKEDKAATEASSAPDLSYGLPKGDWFRYVSSPHYLAEILIYASLLLFFVPTDCCTSWWLVMGFVVSLLSLGARQTHNWYLQKFEDYPRNRNIIIPWLY